MGTEESLGHRLWGLGDTDSPVVATTHGRYVGRETLRTPR